MAYAEDSYPAQAVARETQVAEQCSLIDQCVGSLGKTIEHLEMRLSKVLQSDNDSPPEGSSPEVLLVPLAETLRSYVKCLVRLDARLTNLTNRLEV